MGLVLITSRKPAACVITPVKLRLRLTETTARSQVATSDPEQREAAGSESIERDSHPQFIHRGVQYDSLRSRPAAHKHTVCLTFSSLFLFPGTYTSESDCISEQQFDSTVCCVDQIIYIYFVIVSVCMVLIMMPYVSGANLIYFIIPLGSY